MPAPTAVPDSPRASNGLLTSKEASSLKRGRETSLEPTAAESVPATEATIKKNRLEPESTGRTSPIPERRDDSASPPTRGKKAGETGIVGEVRRKVEKMTHAEGEGSSAAITANAGPKGEETDTESGGASQKDVSKSDDAEHGKDLKRKALDRSESSFVVSDAKRLRDSASPPAAADTADAAATSTEQSKPAATTAASATATAETETGSAVPKRTQATFGAFSGASPFSKPSSSTSAFGSASDAPSAFGSSSAPKPFSSSGFGGFSGSASPFGSKKPSAFGSATASGSTSAFGKSSTGSAGLGAGNSSNNSEAAAASKAADGDASASASAAGPSKNFGDILSGSGAQEEDEGSSKIQMTEKDVVTGEEDESTMFQMRTKLYVMQSDNSWRERGVGVLRLNVRRRDGQGARLVMRAEGVLRLILNVSLYVGQVCMEDGKHVRTTVFEDGERQFVTFRTGSAKAAQELAANIQEHIPFESRASSTISV